MQARAQAARRCDRRSSIDWRNLVAAVAGTLALATILTVLPAHADFVCNAKNKLVNVFLEPPVYRLNTGAPAVGAKWSPADALEAPFDIIDTLPSGARVKVHALAASKGWVWVSFRHSRNGLVGNGYVHISRLSAIRCDADPKLVAAQTEQRQYGIEDGDYFETGPDDPPLDGARGAKRFETSMISGAIRTSRISVECEVPRADYPRPDDLGPGQLQGNPYIESCSELLASNPNFVDALIIRGDIYHRFARTPAPGLDSKSPKWAADITNRKAAQAKAVADWTRAAFLLPTGVPTQLENRLSPGGPVSYDVK